MTDRLISLEQALVNDYRNLILQVLSSRIDYEREAADPDGYLLGLEEAYRLIVAPVRPAEGSRRRHPSSGANPPGQVVLTGSYGADRVLEDGVPAVLHAMLQGAQFGRTVRVRVEEVFGS